MHWAILQQGDHELLSGQYHAAERRYRECLQLMRRLPEAHLRLAISRLYQGDASEALMWIREPIQYTLADYNAATPDPVEWAYFIFAMLCEGRSTDAMQRCTQFAWMRHPELERIRWVVSTVCSGAATSPPAYTWTQQRPSIHRLPVTAAGDAIQQLCVMLRACRQYAAAETVARTLSESGGNASDVPSQAPVQGRGRDYRAAAYFRRRFLYSKLRRRLGRYEGRLRRAAKAVCEGLPSRYENLFRPRVAARVAGSSPTHSSRTN
jgi:hypothetical protein